MTQLVCHLIDANIETAYFSSIAAYHSHDRFPVMIGSIAPAGSLQSSMRKLGIDSFSLEATSRAVYLGAIYRLARLIRKKNVRLVHAHCFDPTVVGLVAARLTGIPFVFTRHHSDHNIRLGKKWHTRIDAFCGERADHVIAVSEITRKIMIDTERVSDHKITVVHNGMETLNEPSADQIQETRTELGLGNETIILMIGRLHEEKGHRYLFNALPAVVSRIGPVVVLLAGDGPQLERIEREAASAGVSDFVKFLGRRDDIPSLLSLASVVVLPSLAESFGFAALEAISLGKPVVAAATGGIPEIVSDGETGLLVPPADSVALGKALVAVLEDKSLARRLGEAGRRRSAQFTFERMMAGYESVYERVLQTPIGVMSTHETNLELQ